MDFRSGLSHAVSAHLIVHDCGPELFDEVDHFLRIFRLVKEPCNFLLV